MPEKTDPRVEAAKQVLRALDVDEAKINRGAAALVDLMHPPAAAVAPWDRPELRDNPEERMRLAYEARMKEEAARPKPKLPENLPSGFETWPPEERMRWHRENCAHRPEKLDPIEEAKKLAAIRGEIAARNAAIELREKLGREWHETGRKPENYDQVAAAAR
jgi:hypothetical protein